MTGISPRQSTGNTTRAGRGVSLQTLLDGATLPNSLIVVIASTTHPRENSSALQTPFGYSPGSWLFPSYFFTRVNVRKEDKLTAGMWIAVGAPATSRVVLPTSGETYGVQMRVLEFPGVAVSGALDKSTFKGDNIEGRPGSNTPTTGSTGTLAQADELVLGFIVNRYGNTTQSSFTGGLSRISESLSYTGEPNHDQSRLSVHYAVVPNTNSVTLSGRLSSRQDWVAGLATFRSSVTGPARLTSTGNTPIVNAGGRGDLTVFGKLTSNPGTPMLAAGGNVHARIGPFDYQYRLGGWSGLLIGDDTPYTLENISGLEGWQMRTSDDEFPRGDGSLRGPDFQTARQILFELRIGSDLAGVKAQQVDVEGAMNTLYRALVPQRDADWELIWRHPDRGLRMLRCRPIDVLRELDAFGTLISTQKFALLAADPRHYGARLRQYRFAAQPTDSDGFTPVLNDGNSFAYPVIRVSGPDTGSVQRIELTNTTYDVSFVVETTLPSGSTLVGDMEARATGAARSIVTIDEQTKYGSWQFPRETFLLGPGENRLHLTTVPADPSVICQVEFRDTYSG